MGISCQVAGRKRRCSIPSMGAGGQRKDNIAGASNSLCVVDVDPLLGAVSGRHVGAPHSLACRCCLLAAARRRAVNLLYTARCLSTLCLQHCRLVRGCLRRLPAFLRRTACLPQPAISAAAPWRDLKARYRRKHRIRRCLSCCACALMVALHRVVGIDKQAATSTYQNGRSSLEARRDGWYGTLSGGW